MDSKAMSTRAHKHLYLFRHGQTDWNAEGRIQGHLNVPLNDRGREQARCLIRPARRIELEAILSSDLVRASETARIVAEPLGIPVFEDSGLREVHFGKLQGLSREEIQAQFGEVFSHRLRHEPLSDADIELIDSETGEQVVERSLGAIVRFLESQPFERIGVASHGGVLRRLIQHSFRGNYFPPPIPNGAFYPLKLSLATRALHLDVWMPL